jgi:hypothetical protein
LVQNLSAHDYNLNLDGLDCGEPLGSSKVQEIERAIGKLTQQELEALKVWLDEYAGPQPIDKTN